MKPWLALAVALSTIHGAEPAPQLEYSFGAKSGVLHVELVMSQIGSEIDLVPPAAWGDAVELTAILFSEFAGRQLSQRPPAPRV